MFFSFLIVSCLLSLPGFAENTETTPASPAEQVKTPKVVVPEMVYEFSDIYEDNEVVHDFVVKNAGEAELDILSVKPG